MTVYREPGVRPVYEDPPAPKPKKTFQPRNNIERQARKITLIWGLVTLMTLCALLTEVFGGSGLRWVTVLRLVANVTVAGTYAYIWWGAYRPSNEK